MIIVLHTTKGEKYVDFFTSKYIEAYTFSMTNDIAMAETLSESMAEDIADWYDKEWLKKCLIDSDSDLDITDVRAIEFRETKIVRI